MIGRAFVTGGSGFIGRGLLRHLGRIGVSVMAPSRGDLDLLDAAATAAAIGEAEPSHVFHLASPGPNSSANAPGLVAAEVAIARNVVAACPAGVRLVFAGSMAEYGDKGRHRETDACHPRNAYAEAKLRAGECTLTQATERGVDAIIARIFGAYGPGEADRRLLPAVIRRLQAGEAVDLSDGTQLRDFVHVGDVAAALVALATVPRPSPAIVNVGTGQAIGMRAVVERLSDQMECPRSLLRFGVIERSQHDQDMLEADTAHLRQTIGWVPPERLLSGADIVDLMRNDPDASISDASVRIDDVPAGCPCP